MEDPGDEADIITQLIGDSVSVKISSLENFKRSRSRVTIDFKGVVIESMPTPQQSRPHLYRLIAIASGLVFLIVIIALSILFPEPTRFQLRVWLVVLSLAAGGFSMSMTGIANIKAGIGTQIAIGATGAFAMALIFYLVNPAIL